MRFTQFSSPPRPPPGAGSLLRSDEMLLPYPPGLRAARMVWPSGPSQIPTLNGMPMGDCSGESGPPTLGAGCQPDESFCVEKPLTPACASRLGSEAGKPKQSGSMYSALALPNSLRKYVLPYSTWRMMASALGMFTSPSSTEEPAGYQRPAATYCLTFSDRKSTRLNSSHL